MVDMLTAIDPAVWVDRGYLSKVMNARVQPHEPLRIAIQAVTGIPDWVWLPAGALRDIRQKAAEA